jgi:hypothetical protein
LPIDGVHWAANLPIYEFVGLFSGLSELSSRDIEDLALLIPDFAIMCNAAAPAVSKVPRTQAPSCDLSSIFFRGSYVRAYSPRCICSFYFALEIE